MERLMHQVHSSVYHWVYYNIIFTNYIYISLIYTTLKRKSWQTSVPVHTVNGEVALQFLNTRTLFNISRTCIIYLILLNPGQGFAFRNRCYCSSLFSNRGNDLDFVCDSSNFGCCIYYSSQKRDCEGFFWSQAKRNIVTGCVGSKRETRSRYEWPQPSDHYFFN